MTRRCLNFLFLTILSLDATAEVQVEFPKGYDTTPYVNSYSFEQFEFHPPRRFGVLKGVSVFPERPPFDALDRFFKALSVSDFAVCQQFFSELNPTVEKSLNSLSKMESLELVADWKQEGHWMVVFSKGGRRGESMIPFVMSAETEPKFVFDARFMGDFVGLLGKFLVTHPVGVLEVVEIPNPTEKAPTNAPKDVERSDTYNQFLLFLIVSTLLVATIGGLIYVLRNRK